MDLLQEMQARFGVNSLLGRGPLEDNAVWLVRLLWLVSARTGVPSRYGSAEDTEYLDNGSWGADRMARQFSVAVVAHARKGVQQAFLYSDADGREEETLAYPHESHYVEEYGPPVAIILAHPDGTAEWVLGGAG